MEFTVDEAARETGRSPKTIRNQAAAGNIPKARKSEKGWLIPIAWVVDIKRRQQRRLINGLKKEE